MRTLEARSSEYQVPVRTDEGTSEFDVQATIYAALKAEGIDIRGEVPWRNGNTKAKRGEVCRFDLVIYRNGAAAEIVEVKGAPVRHKHGLENTRQGRRYVRFGVPVTFVYGMADAAMFINARRGSER